MPRKITAYACQFRCGQRVNTHEEIIEYHEQLCFKNPKNKACPACEHNDRQYDDWGGFWFDCDINAKPDTNNKFIKNCQSFEPKT